jgi:hypothetical protein
MILEMRVFNKRTNKMVYLGQLKAGSGGVFAVAENFQENPLQPDDPIMIKTPMVDKENNRLWEGDIAECGVQTSYGLIKEVGIVVWRGDLNRFSININQSHENQTMFDLVDVLRIGDMYSNPEIFAKINKEKIELMKKNGKK